MLSLSVQVRIEKKGPKKLKLDPAVTEDKCTLSAGESSEVEEDREKNREKPYRKVKQQITY